MLVEFFFLLFLFLFDVAYNYDTSSEFSLVVGLSKNYSFNEFLPWFLVYSYMYTTSVLSGFRVKTQLMCSHKIIRYHSRWKVVCAYIKENFVNICIDVFLILVAVVTRNMLTPSLFFTREYVIQLFILVTIGLCTSLLVFVTRYLYLAIIEVNVYILGTAIFSTFNSSGSTGGVVLKYGSFLNKFAREELSFVALESASIFIVCALMIAYYIMAKKIDYL